jgi:hypothetical protein
LMQQNGTDEARLLDIIEPESVKARADQDRGCIVLEMSDGASEVIVVLSYGQALDATVKMIGALHRLARVGERS